MKKFLVLIVLAMLFVGACSSPPEIAKVETVIVEVTTEPEIVIEVVEQTVEVEVTRIVEVPVTVTFTPGPSPTSTITPTATVTLTPTPTSTPFNVYGCQNLRSVPNYWNIDKEDYEDRLYPTYDALEGKCVKFFWGEGVGLVTTDMGWPFLRLRLAFDEMSPPGIKEVKEYSTVWGIWQLHDPGRYSVLVRRVEAFPDLQQPIEDDGFYMIGSDYDKSAGRWKSLWPPGTIDNCYWARTNPDTGNIKANHFGLAGVYVTLYEGDMFESDDCAPWVYIP